MARFRVFVKYWLPLLLWMGLIFSASSDANSFQHSSRIIEPLLRWLFPNLSQETVDAVVLGVRKIAHLTEYALLAILAWRALRGEPTKNAYGGPRPWNWKQAQLAVLFVLLYAGSDEFHQLFVPTRQASLVDVAIDTLGGGLGIILLWCLGRLFKRW